MAIISELLNPQSLCLLMVLTIYCLYLTGFPAAFCIAGTAFVFAIISMLAGFIEPDLLHAIPEQFYSIMINKTMLAIPPLIFMCLLLEKVQYSETLISDLQTIKSFQKNRAARQTFMPLIAFLTASSAGVATGVLAGGLVIALSSWTKQINQTNENMSGSNDKTTDSLTEHQNSELAAQWSNQNASAALSYLIAPSLILILVADQINAGLANSTAGQVTDLKMTDLFLGAFVLAIFVLAFYLAYHLLKNSMSERNSAGLNNKPSGKGEKEEGKPDDLHLEAEEQVAAPINKQTVSELKNLVIEILSILAAPLLFSITLIGLLGSGFADISEVATIGALAALMLTATWLNPALRKLAFAVIISFYLLILLKSFFELKITTLQTNLFEAAALFLSFALIAILGLGLWEFFKTCFTYKRDDDTSPMKEVLQQTLLQSSMIFALLLLSSVFLLLIKGLETGPLIQSWLLNMPGGTPVAILAALISMLFLAMLLPHLLAVILFVPIITPQLTELTFSNGNLVNPLWLALLVVMTLQLAYLLRNNKAHPSQIPQTQSEEGPALTNEPKVTYLAKLKCLSPYLFIHMIVMTILWFSPELLQFIGL